MTDIELELYHHGVKGMKWGRRRYQNADGTLTPAGKKRYDDSPGTDGNKSDKDAKKAAKEAKKLARANADSEYAAKRILAEEIGYAEHDIKRYNKKLSKMSGNLDRYYTNIDKAHDKGNFTKRDKYIDKYFDTFDKMEAYTIKVDEVTQRRDFYKRKCSEIEKGILKAGEDYVAHYIEGYNGTAYIKNTNLEFLTDKGRN